VEIGWNPWGMLPQLLPQGRIGWVHRNEYGASVRGRPPPQAKTSQDSPFD